METRMALVSASVQKQNEGIPGNRIQSLRRNYNQDVFNTVRPLVEALLERLFPPSFVIYTKTETPGSQLDIWSRYEVPMYSKHDPFRPMGPFDSWAGNVKRKWKI